jgi:hypothetical protein
MEINNILDALLANFNFIVWDSKGSGQCHFGFTGISQGYTIHHNRRVVTHVAAIHGSAL